MISHANASVQQWRPAGGRFFVVYYPQYLKSRASLANGQPQPDPTNGWGDTYARTVHGRNLYSNELARFRQKYPGHEDDPTLVSRIQMYDRQIAHMNSVIPSGELRSNIASAGGAANRQPHGPITKAAPDRVYAGLANAAGAGANLTGDIDDLAFGAPVNAIDSKVDPGAPKLQFNTEPYYGYDQPAGFGASVRDLPNALSTAGTDLYNHPLMTLLQQGQYLDPNSFVVPDASVPSPAHFEGTPSPPPDLAPAGEYGNRLPSQANVEPTGDRYSIAYQMSLDPADWGRSDTVHLNRANAALDAAIKSDPVFAARMEEQIPGVRNSVSSVNGRRTPQDWTWHHAQDPGVVELVPKVQHTSGSIFWRTLHPGGVGGYSIWARPAGAPKR